MESSGHFSLLAPVVGVVGMEFGEGKLGALTCGSWCQSSSVPSGCSCKSFVRGSKRLNSTRLWFILCVLVLKVLLGC